MFNISNESELKLNGACVVKFGATWCQPCKVLTTTIEKLEKEFPDINFMSIDIDELPSLAQSYKIKTIPTLLIIKDGSELNRIQGLSLISPMRKIFREISPL